MRSVFAVIVLGAASVMAAAVPSSVPTQTPVCPSEDVFGAPLCASADDGAGMLGCAYSSSNLASDCPADYSYICYYDDKTGMYLGGSYLEAEYCPSTASLQRRAKRSSHNAFSAVDERAAEKRAYRVKPARPGMSF